MTLGGLQQEGLLHLSTEGRKLPLTLERKHSIFLLGDKSEGGANPSGCDMSCGAEGGHLGRLLSQGVLLVSKCHELGAQPWDMGR